MKNSRFLASAVVATLMAVSTAVPAEARWGRHGHHGHHGGRGAAIVGGFAAGILGSMLVGGVMNNAYARPYAAPVYPAPVYRVPRERIVDVYRSRRSGERLCQTNYGRIGYC